MWSGLVQEGSLIATTYKYTLLEYNGYILFCQITTFIKVFLYN